MKTNKQGTLVALDVAKAVAAGVAGVVGRMSPELAGQAKRAAISVPLNTSEAMGRTGRDRRYRLRIAYGSAKELETAVELAVAFGEVPGDEVAVLLGQLDRLGGLLYGLERAR
jgi:four helix bundle protein